MIPGCFKRHPEVYVLGVLGAVSALVSQMLSWGFQNGYLLLQREFQRIPRGFLQVANTSSAISRGLFSIMFLRRFMKFQGICGFRRLSGECRGISVEFQVASIEVSEGVQKYIHGVSAFGKVLWRSKGVSELFGDFWCHFGTIHGQKDECMPSKVLHFGKVEYHLTSDLVQTGSDLVRSPIKPVKNR